MHASRFIAGLPIRLSDPPGWCSRWGFSPTLRSVSDLKPEAIFSNLVVPNFTIVKSNFGRASAKTRLKSFYIAPI